MERRSLVLLSVPFLAGWLLLLLVRSYAALLLGRLLTGLAGGAFVLAAPAYSAEIAEPRYRGALGSLMQLVLSTGILTGRPHTLGQGGYADML